MYRARLIGALCASFCLLNGFITPIYATGISGQGTWETTLQPRDLDGNLSTAEAYYDTDLNITWLANANLAASNSFGLAYLTDLGPYPGDPSGYNGFIFPQGYINWPGAKFWIDAMNTANYLGYNGWRLPTVTDTGTAGCNLGYTGTDCGWNVDTATGEMAHMFYTTLGDRAYYDTSGNYPQAGWGLTNTGPFSNLQSYSYWSATGYALHATLAWHFDFLYGVQFQFDKTNTLYGWVVHSGDVGAAVVPLPAAVWLFGSGLLGLISVGRKCRR
jgi:hypothetical protein